MLDDSPVAYWRLGESSPSGPDSVLDETANGYHLQPFNSPAFGQTGLISSSADTAVLMTAASEHYIERGDVLGILDFPFTFEAWYKGIGDGTLFSFSAADADATYYMIRILGGLATLSARNFTPYNVGTIAVDDDTPHHIVGVFESTSSRKIYVDGAFDVQSTDAASWNGATNHSAIGYLLRLSSSGVYLDGTVDEVAVYDSALSAAQILAHYNAA